MPIKGDKDKVFDKAKKLIKQSGLDIAQYAPKITTGYIKGKRFEFKFKPRNVLQVAEEILGIKTLSDNQKFVLVDLWGLDPEMWKLDWSEAILRIGMRGGKNTVLEISDIYLTQHIMNWVDPYAALEYYAQKPFERTQDFEFTNNSMVSAEQSEGVYFNRIKKLIRKAINPETGRNIYTEFLGLDIREEGLGDMRKKIIEFPFFGAGLGRMIIHSLDSGVSTFEGKNIIKANMDEPSRADTPPTYTNAGKLWKGLTANTANTYPNGVGKAMACSYLNTSEYDLVEKLANEELEAARRAKEEGKERKSIRKVYTYSTFEFNPYVKKDSPKVQQDYQNDLDDALARYECVKRRTQNAFFKPHIHKIRECVSKEIQNRVTYSRVFEKKRMNDNSVKMFTMLDVYDVKPDSRYRIWAADTSVNTDRFVIGSAYNEQIERDLGEYFDEKVTLPTSNRVVIDTLLIWEPTKEYPIDFHNVNQVMDRLLNNFPNSAFFASDPYQAESLASVFTQRGINTEVKMFSNAMQWEYYTLLRLGVFNNQITYLENELMLSELERVQKIGDKKVDHPLEFSKDVADVVALLFKHASTLDFSQISDSNGLDRVRDGRLINLVNQYVVLMNEVRNNRPNDPKKYICEKLKVTPQELEKIIELKEVYFPTVKH